MSIQELNLHLEKVYDFDVAFRKVIYKRFITSNPNYNGNPILTGSLVEGAFVVPSLVKENKNFDIDMMFGMGGFSRNRASTILIETDYPGYYRINVEDSLVKDIYGRDADILSLLNGNGTIETIMKEKNWNFVGSKNGRPSATVTVTEASNIEKLLPGSFARQLK